MSGKERSRGLGRGLSALLADAESSIEVDDVTSESAQRAGVTELPIEFLVPNQDQPRRNFPKEQLSELADSIREKGVIQPILVRKFSEKDEQYQIVAGERRWRAAQLAALHSVPVIVKSLSDRDVLEIAIIENIQRQDLNAIDEALAYKQLMDKFEYTQDELAKTLGKSRPYVANSLRLVNLPKQVQEYVIRGDISAGHARALVAIENPQGLADQIVKNGWSVRELEASIKRGKSESSPSQARQKHIKDADTIQLESEISANIKMPVSIEDKGGKGHLTISYKSLDELDKLCQILSKHSF